MAPLSRSLPPYTNGMGRFLWESQVHYKPKLPAADVSFADQTGIITGANVGLGLESAKMLLDAKLSRLIMAVRSLDRGEAAAKKLREDFPNAQIDVWLLDMESYDSITEFVNRCESLSRVDFIILNSAIGHPDFVKSSSTGHERTFQVNYLSQALLIILLLPVLKSRGSPSKAAVVTLVSSGLALHATFPEKKSDPLFPALDNEKTWPGPERYRTSKLLGQMFVAKLAEFVNGNDVTINMVDPGYTKGTSLHRSITGWMKMGMNISKALIARSTEEGASTYIDAVMRGEESHGSFLFDWDIGRYPAIMHTQEGKHLGDRLWEETMKEFESFNVRDIVASMKTG